MFKKTALVAGLGLALSATAHAEYQAELDFAISGGDNDGFELGGTYYLDSVDDSKGALGEAAFLDHASSISIGYGESEFDDSDNQIDRMAIGGRYVTSDSHWIFDLNLENIEADSGGEADIYSIGLGKYLTDRTTLVLNFSNIDVDDGGDEDVYGVDIKHVFAIGEDELSLNAGFSTADTDDEDVDRYDVGATWYPCNSLGIGVDYANTDAGSIETDDYSISAEWFISNQVSVSATYLESEIDDTDFETDSFVIGTRVRF